MKNSINFSIRNSKGITLIALVVTIIILIILAGISINLILGENGIIIKARESAEKTKEAELKESISLAFMASQIVDGEYKEINQTNFQNAVDNQLGSNKAIVTDNGNGMYSVVLNENGKEFIVTSKGVEEGKDWNTIFANAKIPVEQKNKHVIGIGTDGEVVNMDLWEYTKLEDGTYGLNDEEVFKESGTRTSGYDNSKLVGGKIQGTIPQYIKSTTDTEFIPVTKLNYLFFNTDIEEAPVIPGTVTDMRATFNSCKKLIKMPAIPGNVTNMYGTFAACSNLVSITTLPDSVISMLGTFNGCTALTVAPKIPKNTIDMHMTFKNCTSLTTAPIIPNSVTNMQATFESCSKLTIAPEIPNNVTNMYGTFYNCVNLKKAPIIPNSVTVLCAAFKNCSNLQGTIEINANVTGKQLGEEFVNNIDYNNCLLGATTNSNIQLKVIGTCEVLQQIINDANNSQITL